MVLGIVIALLAGLFISTQGSINGLVGNRIGVTPTVIVPVAYQILLYSTALLMNRKWWTELTAVTQYPMGWGYLLISALLGIGIMITITMSMMRIGPLLGLAIIVLSQLGMSMIIEHFGWFQQTQRAISLNRVLGLLLFVIGIWFFVRK